MFLEKDDEIAALVFVIMLSLLIYSIIEMLCRSNKFGHREGSDVHPLHHICKDIDANCIDRGSIYELVASLLILVISVFIMITLSAKIFRTRILILMYGKKMKIKDILRYLRG